MKEIEQLEIECQSSSPCGWKGPLSKLKVRAFKIIQGVNSMCKKCLYY